MQGENEDPGIITTGMLCMSNVLYVSQVLSLKEVNGMATYIVHFEVHQSSGLF